MAYDSTTFQIPELHYAALFEAMPGNSVLVKNDAPRYTILAATPAYLKQTGYTKEKLVGKGVFEAFPANTMDPEDTGESMLQASYKTVSETKNPHFLPVQRYDLQNEDGSFTERFWKTVNSPVFDANGNVVYIINAAEDITAQVQADKVKEKYKALEQVHNLFLQAPAAINILKGQNLIVELANKPCLEIWNKGEEEVIGQPLLDTLPELRDQGFEQLVQQIRETGQSHTADGMPVTLIREGKEQVVYFNWVIQPYYEENDTTPTGVVTFATEVTEQVISKQKLEESEGRFRLLADASPILIWMLNEDGSYKYVNKTTLDFLNITQEQIAEVGWAPFLHPDDVAFASQAIARAVQHKEPYEAEHRLLHKDGEYRWVLSQALPTFDANGHVYAYVGSSIDIHEARQSREALQTALEQARLSKEAAELGTFDLDLVKGTMHWDARCRILFGINHQEPVNYEKDFVEGLHPNDRERILEVIRQAFMKSVSNGDYDVEYRTIGAEDGVVRWVRAKGKVYFDRTEKPVRFIGSVLDITEQVTAIQKIEKVVEERTLELAEANKRLLTINEELKRSNANLEEFAHAASHDMKEPIRKVLTFSDRLKKTLEPRMTEGEKQLFSRVENATQRMGILVDDLLEFSHVSDKPLDKELVDLDKKVKKVLVDLELLIEEKGARIQVDPLPTVSGYKRQLQQLFHNLIGNALKYSKPGQAPEIVITSRTVVGKDMAEKVRPDQWERPFYLIEVRDNGIGFEQQYAGKIFKMFQRLHGKAEYPGTGVGLSIVRKVVDNHDGYIWATGGLSVGAIFHVLLPAGETGG